MSRLFWLAEEQVVQIAPFFPKERGVGRSDDRKVLSGIIYVIKNGLQWVDAPLVYGPHKTLYNRFKRWSENGVFERTFEELVTPQNDAGNILMIDATHRKAHRTASSLKKGATNQG
ncbi:transposase, IS4 family protein [Roseibium sp. TrichSKD4]|nr:transposase, IS4 family protein [Roseibium sp. TrichSKD4]